MIGWRRRAWLASLQGDATISALKPRDRRAVLAHLRQEPCANVYLLAQVARGALGRPELAGAMLGVWEDGCLLAVAIAGSNLVISEPATEAAIDLIASTLAHRASRFRVVVGPDRTVDRFMDCYGRDTRPIQLERGGQLLFQVDAYALNEDARESRLRPAGPEELEAVIRADRAMVVEELGYDPFAADLQAYRLGWLRRLREGRTWVIGARGATPLFKVDQSAVAGEAIQLAGVWTAPEARRQGMAARGVGELCHRLLQDVPAVTLYVNGANTPAIRLYERLGFRNSGRVRSVWFGAS